MRSQITEVNRNHPLASNQCKELIQRLYILYAVKVSVTYVRMYVRTYVRNGGRGQLSSESRHRHNENDVIRTGAASAASA